MPIDAHDPVTPRVYLEVIVCTPDTKEHESLVMTRARPSHVHAALLAAGLEPGAPASWRWDEATKTLLTVPPTGAPVDVRLIVGGTEVRATDWIVHATSGARLLPKGGGPGWVFAGSTMATRAGREVYDADGTGTLIGLAAFGMETIAWQDVISHEADVEEPVWIADAKAVPKFGTAVTVRIRAADPTAQNPGI